MGFIRAPDDRQHCLDAGTLALARRFEDEGKVPVGAVILRDGEVLGDGRNRPVAGHDVAAYAEIQS